MDAITTAPSKWHLIVDVAECHNCSNCVLAAKDEFVGNDFPGYSAPHATQGAGVIRIERHVRGSGHHVDTAHVPRMCNHCDDAPCVKAGGGAVTQRDDGIVIFDPVKSHGRRDLVDACPHGAVVWNEERQLPQTWIFDAHLLDAGWKEPRCVTVCPTQAMRAMKLDEEAMAALADREALRPLHPELGTKPRVLYRNLHRALSAFIAGSVVQRGDCAEDAEVHLLRDGQPIAQACTDAFGDFRFDGLAPGAYTLHVRHGDVEAERTVELTGTSAALSDIALAP
jgi:Fe-S-cluster-containing dehydrogenase component